MIHRERRGCGALLLKFANRLATSRRFAFLDSLYVYAFIYYNVFFVTLFCHNYNKVSEGLLTL